MKIQLIELHKLQDLLALSKHFLFRMDFDNLGLSVYYSGITSDMFIGLNIFMTDKKYSGNTAINARGEIISKDRMTTTTVNIIAVKSDTLLRGIFANYIVANFGYEKKYKELTDRASKLLAEIKAEKATSKHYEKEITQRAENREVSLREKSVKKNVESVKKEK